MKATDAFKAVLENCGNKNIDIKEVPPPPHVIEYLIGEDSEMTDDEIAETIPYFRVISAQGSFGIIVQAYNLLDIKDTGFNAFDLGEEDAGEDFFLANLNTVTLRHLRKFLEKRKRLN